MQGRGVKKLAGLNVFLCCYLGELCTDCAESSQPAVNRPVKKWEKRTVRSGAGTRLPLAPFREACFSKSGQPPNFIRMYEIGLISTFQARTTTTTGISLCLCVVFSSSTRASCLCRSPNLRPARRESLGAPFIRPYCLTGFPRKARAARIGGQDPALDLRSRGRTAVRCANTHSCGEAA
jgi:hypothetical protein